MYELITLTPRDHYIQSPTRIGLILLQDNHVCLIDSGSDKDAGRKVRQLLDSHGWHLDAIYNTHSNADHTGANQYLQRQTGCKIYSPSMECALIRHPLLEPSFLYGGYPFSDLRHKFLMAQESNCQVLVQEVLPQGITMIPLPGHFFQMTGFRTADDTVYLADSLCSHQTLQKYQISFIYDVAAYLQTLEKIKSMPARLFVPAHAEPSADIAPLAQLNIDKVYEIAQRILALCIQPITTELVIKALFTELSLTMTYEQYVLVGSTVRSYLAWLKDTGHLHAQFEDNLLVWTRA